MKCRELRMGLLATAKVAYYNAAMTAAKEIDVFVAQ